VAWTKLWPICSCGTVCCTSWFSLHRKYINPKCDHSNESCWVVHLHLHVYFPIYVSQTHKKIAIFAAACKPGHKCQMKAYMYVQYSLVVQCVSNLWIIWWINYNPHNSNKPLRCCAIFIFKYWFLEKKAWFVFPLFTIAYILTFFISLFCFM